MGVKENLELIEQLQEAARDQDFDRYGQLLADDATFRAAGVPAGLGGVLRGREAIVEQLRRSAGESSFEVKRMFGDDRNVCVVGKVAAQRFIGSEHLRGADRPYSTYECLVYEIADGKVAESTTYVNWLDPYVQMGLVDVSTLTR
jgi:ketosteroid isomerase-like protein